MILIQYLNKNNLLKVAKEVQGVVTLPNDSLALNIIENGFPCYVEPTPHLTDFEQVLIATGDCVESTDNNYSAYREIPVADLVLVKKKSSLESSEPNPEALGIRDYVQNGVIRLVEDNGELVWQFIDDYGHKKTNFSTIDGGNSQWNANITYPQVQQIGALLVANDEKYARYAISAGFSVGGNSSQMFVYRNYFEGRFSYVSSIQNVAFAEDTGSLHQNEQFICSFNAPSGELTISHPDLVFRTDSVPQIAFYGSNTFYAVVKTKTPTSVTFLIYNRSNDTLRTSFSSLFRFFYTRLGSYKMPNRNLNIGGSNFWLMGSH